RAANCLPRTRAAPLLYVLLLVLQVACLALTQSRGPFVGLLSGLFAGALLYAFARDLRRLAVGTLAAGLTLLILLTLLNLAAGPLAPWRGVPVVERLVRVFETESGSGQVRTLIWDGALRLALPHP